MLTPLYVVQSLVQSWNSAELPMQASVRRDRLITKMATHTSLSYTCRDVQAMAKQTPQH